MALFKKEKILYYGGCIYNHKLKKQTELYEKILDKLGVKYILKDEICCGAKLYELGYEAEARKLARRNFNLFNQAKINKIITPCPECYKFFLKNYKELLPDWPELEIEHVSVTILRELDRKQKLIKNPKLGEQVIYHDSCELKNCKITREPRELLRLLGYELVEMGGGIGGGCCGGCGILSITNPELAGKITSAFFKQAEKAGIDRIIAIGDCYLGLKKFKPDEIEVLELAEAAAYCLGLNSEENE